MKVGLPSLMTATALAAALTAQASAQVSSGTETSPDTAETQVLDELRVLDTAEAQARQALASSAGG